MANFITRRIGLKIALMVCFIMFIVIIPGMAFIIIQQGEQLENEQLKRGKILSIIGAKIIGRVLDEAVDNAIFPVDDLFDKDYVEIPGFDPPKYHTKYDFYLDKSILAIQDEFLKDSYVIYATAVDTNGYLPTHNTRFNKPPTGDKIKDLEENKSKRIFNDSIGLKAARNQKESFVQQSSQGSAGVVWDISSPIFVKGKHWGGFRVGLSNEAIDMAKQKLVMSLATTMAIILGITILSVFILISRSLKPLRILIKFANKFADGEVEQKIEVTTPDEIGQLADVLERLRVSIKTAMDRLMKK